MIPFFIIFVAFLIILSIQLHRGRRAQEEIDRRFWEREQEANHVRRQDISKLDYLTFPTELIPGNLGTDAEKALLSMNGKKMLNLTAYTNTDLKLMYGAANLDELSLYESAYVDMISQLAIYAKELIESGDTDSAEKLLAFAVECGDDSYGIYLPLARIYKDKGDTEALSKLLKTAESLTTIGAGNLLAQLRELSASS